MSLYDIKGEYGMLSLQQELDPSFFLETVSSERYNGQILVSLFEDLNAEKNEHILPARQCRQLPKQPITQWTTYVTLLRTVSLVVLCGLFIHPLHCHVMIICGEVWKTSHIKQSTHIRQT